MSYTSVSADGLGAIDFNAGVAWSDWLAGASGDNAAGMRAADAIRAALGQLGYGPFALGHAWGTAQDKAGYSAFASQQGIASAPGMPAWWPTQVGLTKLGELVQAGGTPGGGPVQEFHSAGGQLVPGAAPGTSPLKAGMSTGTLLGLAAAGLVVVGALALFAKKRPEEESSSRRSTSAQPGARTQVGS